MQIPGFFASASIFGINPSEGYAPSLTSILGRCYIYSRQAYLANGGLMTREEILEKSRSEMQGKDIVDMEISKKAIVVGWIMAVVLAMIVTIIDAIVYSRLPVEILFAVLGGLATVFWIKYFKLHKRHELLVAALYTVSSLCFLIAWILHIVG